MKVAVWLRKDREVLYDADTDELIVRDVSVRVDGTERVDRIPFAEVLLARAKGQAFTPKRPAVNKKKQ